MVQVMRTSRLPWLLVVVLVAACSRPDAAVDAAGGPPTEFGGSRPAKLQVPAGYDPIVPTPLLVVLHGFGANGAVQVQYTKLGRLVAAAGILLLAPNGTARPGGARPSVATCSWWPRPR